MREIKFRGKRKDNGEWVYGNLTTLYYPKQVCISFEGSNQDLSNTKFNEVDPETVGEFTGLKDKNGKECFENDSCKLYQMASCSCKEDEFIAEGIVVYNGSGFKVYDKEDNYYWNLDIDLFYFEIIGNIHEE